MIEMGVLIRAAEHKFAMSYKGFGQLRRDLAGLIGAEAAMNGTAGWPDVEQPSPGWTRKCWRWCFCSITQTARDACPRSNVSASRRRSRG